MSELVLPNGQIATVRQILVSDIAAHNAAEPALALATLAALVTTLDDAPLSVDDIMAMDYADALPIFTAINKQLLDAFRLRNGVA